MRRSVRRWLYSVGAVTAAGATAWGLLGTASAAQLSLTRSASASPATSAAYVPPNHDLYFGDSGPAVKSVQERLAQLKYYPGPIDGQYGQDTAEAVWAFKEVQGLPMNAASNTIITYKFRRDLINPKLPKVLEPKGGASRIEINQNDEVLVLYKNNKVALILHVSTGGGYYYPCPGDAAATCGPAVTPDGTFYPYLFQSGWVVVPLGTMYNPIWFSPGYAIHGDIPVPWYPASHGCVRIWMDAAAWFYQDVSIGGAHPTPIYIKGVAPYQPSIVG